MAEVRKVALMFPVTRVHEGRVLRGLRDYASQRGSWTIVSNPDMLTISLRVLAPLPTASQLRAAKALGVPVVNSAGALRKTGLLRVMVDQEAVGRLAAEYLLHRGFRRFAYYGQRGMWYSQQRQRGLVQQVTEAGGECFGQDSRFRREKTRAICGEQPTPGEEIVTVHGQKTDIGRLYQGYWGFLERLSHSTLLFSGHVDYHLLRYHER